MSHPELIHNLVASNQLLWLSAVVKMAGDTFQNTFIGATFYKQIHGHLQNKSNLKKSVVVKHLIATGRTVINSGCHGLRIGK